MPAPKRPGPMNKFKIKEISMVGNNSLSPYIDHKWMYEAFGDYENDHKIKILAEDMAKDYPSFIGETGEMMEIFGKRMVKRTTDKEFISVEVELPKQKTNHTKIIRVDCPPDAEKIGWGGTTFEMTVRENTLSYKNFYGLRYCPGTILKITSMKPIPDGVRGWKYTFKLYGSMDDYVNLEDLKNGELVNMGAHMEEAALTRGHVSMGAMGRAFACYRFPMTRMGFQMQVTDLGWRTGKFYRVRDEKCKDDRLKKIVFSDLSSNFHFQSESAYENWIMWGRAPSVKDQLRFTDPITGRPYSTGPSVLDFFRSAGGETYNCHNFNIEKLLSKIQRLINKSGRKDKGKIVVDVFTGTGGFTEKILPELKRLDPGCSGCDGVYGVEEGFTEGRKAYTVGGRTFRSIYLDPFGKVKFHISSMLDSGVFSGRTTYKGWPMSSYWMIIMIGSINGKNETNSAITIFENKTMEQRGYVVGDWTPSGPRLVNGENSRRWAAHDGTLGNSYRIIQDFYKGVFVPDFNNLHILYPNMN